MALLGAALALLILPKAHAQEQPPQEQPPQEQPPQEQPPQPPQGLVPPSLLEAPDLVLPPDAEPLPPDTFAIFLLTIGRDGSVQEARLLLPIREDVDPLVVEAAQEMRFSPATRDGTPIPARIRFRVRVTPPPPEPPPPEQGGEGGEGGEENSAGGGEGEENSAGGGGGEENSAGSGTGEGEGEGGEGLEVVEGEGAITEYGASAAIDRPEEGAANRITLQGEELTTVPGTFGEPLRVVATLPGVARSPFGLGFFLVRGAAFQNTGFLVDGFPVPILYHLGAGPAVLNSRLVERLRFYPGGYPLQYGRFSAGVIALDTAPPPTDSFRVELEVDFFRASALAIVPFDNGRGTVTASFRRSYYELLLPLVIQGVDLNYTDYQARIDYRLTGDVRASLFFFGSDDRLDQSGALGGGMASDESSTVIGYNFQRLIGAVEARLPNEGRFKLSFMLGRDENFFNSAQAGQADLYFGNVGDYGGLRFDLRTPWEGAENVITEMGVDINTVAYTLDVTAPTPGGFGLYPSPGFDPQTSDISIDLVRASAAFYWDQIFHLGPAEWSLGVRFDYMRYGDVSDVFPDPRTVFKIQAVPEWLLLKISTGLFTQSPSPVFQISRVGGNPSLGPQRSWQSSVGLELTLPEHIEIHATGFYNRMWGIGRNVNQVVPNEDGSFRRIFFTDDGEGQSYGLEVMVRRRVADGLYGWLSYTLSRSERFLAGGEPVPFSFDQTHVLNLAASYAIDGWRFGVGFQLATGRPTSTFTGGIYDVDGEGYDPVRVDRGERLPTFHRLDLRIDRDFEIGPVRGSVYVDVRNAYNATNAEGWIYQYDFQRRSPLPGLPILPTIGIRGSIQ